MRPPRAAARSVALPTAPVPITMRSQWFMLAPDRTNWRGVAVSMAPMMRAITIRGGKGGADALQVQDVPAPEFGPGHVLVRVRAAGVNRPDLLQRCGPAIRRRPERPTSSASRWRARSLRWARA